MTVRKNMGRIGGHGVVEINADIGKLTKNRGGKTEPRHEEIARALMSQDYSYAMRHFFADSAKEETDDRDRLPGVQILLSRRLHDSGGDRGHAGHVAPTFPESDARRAKNKRTVHRLDVRLCSTYETLP